MSLFRPTWSMLLWKEWRQQRLPFLALGIVALACYVMYDRVSNGKPDIRGLFVLTVLVSTCLGANAFAAEKDDRTDVFLGALPVPPWRRGVVKYALVVLLACLCLAVPFAMCWPESAVPLSQYDSDVYRAHWRMMFVSDASVATRPLLVLGVSLVTASVSLTCLLAGRGLGALATLISAFACWSVWAFVSGWGEAWIIRGLGRYGLAWGKHQTATLGLAWGMAHIGAIVPWFGASRTPRHPVRSLVLWLPAILLLPILTMAVPATYRGLVSGPREYASVVDPWYPEGGLSVLPSPDGKTLAVVAHPALRSHFRSCLAAVGMWLLDVDSGAMHRVGRWRHASPQWLWSGSSCWSPDGRHLLIESTEEDGLRDWLRTVSAPTPRGDVQIRDVLVNGSRAKTMAPIGKAWDESTGPLDHGQRRLREMGLSEGLCGWLGDGTRAYRTDDGWEFHDGRTGKNWLCKDPIPDTSAPRYRPESEEQQLFWLDHGTAAIRTVWGVRGMISAVFLYKPGLAEPERIDVPMDGVAQPPLFTVDVSRDGKWLLGTHYGDRKPPYYLVSLRDRTVRVLPRPASERGCTSALFTPDSEYIVTVAPRALGFWSIGEQKWEPETPFGPSDSIHPLGEGPIPQYGISPGRPWRVFVVMPPPELGMYVVNLEDRTSLCLPIPVESNEAAEREALVRHGHTLPPDWTPSVPSATGDWLGNDRLIIRFSSPREFWVINADGTNPREILR